MCDDGGRARAPRAGTDHANKAGKKILMSGGGRCNFTNLYTEPANFLSRNPHFCKSALARYTQWDFIGLVAKHQVPYHEKKLGQLFCDNKSSDILGCCCANAPRPERKSCWTPRSKRSPATTPATTCVPAPARCAASRW